MRVDLDLLSVGVRMPLRPRTAPPLTRPLVLVTMRDADGVEGYGEAAPLEEYDSVSVERVLLALRMYMPRLVTADVDAHKQVLATCANVDSLPQALAAIDMAFWDLAARRAGRPLWSLLAAEEAEQAGAAPVPLPVNATIGAVDPASAAQEASEAVADGFACIKVKVGTPDDVQRLEAVRAAVGPAVALRVDANGAWNEWSAATHLRALARFEIELFEEPVHGVEQLAALAAAVPDARIAADESARAMLAPPPEGTDAPPPRRCDAVCLKVASSGGVSGLLRDARAARARGYETYFASTLDGPLGIAAALHVAAVLRPERHCGLATLARFDEPVPESLVPSGGLMRVPPGAGLGDGLTQWYA